MSTLWIGIIIFDGFIIVNEIFYKTKKSIIYISEVVRIYTRLQVT